MWVIADNSKKIPVYLWKRIHKMNLVTYDLKDAKIFNTSSEASLFLKEMKDEVFNFNVHSLIIK